MLPHEKTLVKRLEKEPFALIGVNSDGGVEKLREILKQRELNWRQAVDGSTEGPWASQWNVSGWPTIYVLDAKGVIRYRDVREGEMDKAVDALLAEAKRSQ